ncbi:MAG: hypothetical protein FJW85_07325 [Actinobacteria bacterium]|nr:hypothetical protein [Actinomycetota bacterium]
MAMSLLAMSLGVVGLLLPVVTAAPAQANIKVKSQYCGTNPTGDTSIPTPSAATDVTARKSGVERGKARVYWAASNSYEVSGYTLWAQILTSDGQCTQEFEQKPGGCPLLKAQGYMCKLKRLNSGSTEFRVALWYGKRSGPSGPVVYSDWSASVNVT